MHSDACAGGYGGVNRRESKGGEAKEWTYAYVEHAREVCGGFESGGGRYDLEGTKSPTNTLDSMFCCQPKRFFAGHDAYVSHEGEHSTRHQYLRVRSTRALQITKKALSHSPNMFVFSQTWTNPTKHAAQVYGCVDQSNLTLNPATQVNPQSH